MSTATIEDGDPLTIVLRGGNTPRLFGIPFLVVGGYLGYGPPASVTAGGCATDCARTGTGPIAMIVSDERRIDT